MRKKLLLIFSLAFLIRLVSLSQSLWLDEATTAKVIHAYTYANLITQFSPFDFHPPLYYLFMKWWSSFFGYSEIALRMPSVLFSLLAGFAVYKIGVLLKDKKTGFWAMLFFLFNPLIIYYSQEARMYMMATFFLSGGLYFLTKMLKDQSRSDFFLFNLFCLLSFYTFYGSVFFIFPMYLLLGLTKKYKLLLTSVLIFFLGVIPLFPLLYTQFVYSRKALMLITHWSLVLGKISLKNLLLIPLKFSTGRISFNPKVFYYVFTGIWTLVVWGFALKGIAKQKMTGILLFAPLLLGFVFSFFSPLLQYFRFLYCIIPLSLLMGVVAVKKWQHYFLLAGLVFFSLLYLLVPQFHREDWKSLAHSLINAHSVYIILPSSDPLRYYAPTLPVKELRTLEEVQSEKEITVIPYTFDVYGFDYKKELEKRGFSYKNTKSFRGVWYEIWTKNNTYAGNFLYSLAAI